MARKKGRVETARQRKNRERKQLMADVAERDKKNGVTPKRRKTAIQVVDDNSTGGNPYTIRGRKGGAPERGLGPTGPRQSRAFIPPMGKPKSRAEMSLWERWYESHGDRFDSYDEARAHFREKVCEHKNKRHISTKNRPDSVRIHIFKCEGCGLMTETRHAPSGH